MINNTRVLLDVASLAVQLREEGHIVTAAKHTAIFLNAIRGIPIRSLENFPEVLLKEQYKDYLKNLSR